MDTPARGSVLVVEDEPVVRLVAGEALGDSGFDVIEADSADHAIELLNTREDIGVVFTDVNMPGSMDGLALAELVHKRWPDIKLIVTSGQNLRGPVPDDGRFLQKPYTLSEMTDTVCNVSGKAKD